MVASTPARVTTQNKGTAPACIGVGRVSLATAGSLAGKAAGEGPRQSSSQCFVG